MRATNRTPDWPEDGQRPEGADENTWQKYLRRRNARLNQEQSQRSNAGRQVLGRNIWGGTGYVNTHYPADKPISAPPNAAWVDKHGDLATITVGGTEYMLDQSNWSRLINTQSEGAINYIEKRLKDAGFFHISELPSEARQNVQTDFAVRESATPMYTPNELRRDVPNVDRDNGEPMLIPPHIYHYEPAPDETYSLEYDNGAHYLPPVNPNAEPYTGGSKTTPKDYDDGVMPPVGDVNSEGYSLDDYLDYAPPVDRDAKRPFVYERLEPEHIPLLPDWPYNDSEPTANSNILTNLMSLGRAERRPRDTIS